MLTCLILAGGVGSRMRPLTNVIPKALVQVANEPFIDLQLRWLRNEGVSDVVLAIGYRGALLRTHVGDGSRCGLSVRYVNEGGRRLGTGGSVRLAVDEGAVGDAFFVLYGDAYLRVDFSAVEAAWRSSNLPGMMTVLRNDNRWGPSNARYSGGMVTLYDKTLIEGKVHWVDYGLLVLTAAAVKRRIARDTAVDLGDALGAMSLDHELAGFPVRRRFYEVGSPDGVRQLERYLRRGAAPLG
jgi:N-acetyl-alpha-D-muramate 1-phosphate uridylyltransferase